MNIGRSGSLSRLRGAVLCHVREDDATQRQEDACGGEVAREMYPCNCRAVGGDAQPCRAYLPDDEQQREYGCCADDIEQQVQQGGLSGGASGAQAGVFRRLQTLFRLCSKSA